MSEHKGGELSRKKRILKKGKRHLVRLVYGRMFLIAALFIAEMVFLWLLFYRLSTYSVYLYAGMLVLTVASVLHIFNAPSDPTVKLSWLVVVTVFMPFGSAFYLWVKSDLGHRKLVKKADQATKDARDEVPMDRQLAEDIRQTYPQMYGLVRYAEMAGGYGIYKNSSASYYSCGEELFPELLNRLRKAEKFIFLEYFIISEGVMWDAVKEILVQKAREGVEVRLMYDGTNEFKNLPHSFPKQMEELGIQCHIFAPIHPVFSTEQNFRDHRKILVIDGVTAFTGGINLADEYINRISLYGYWKDTAIMIQGEAVRSFTRMFLEAWQVTEGVKGNYSRYLKISEQTIGAFLEDVKKRGEALPGYMVPYADNPLDNDKLGEWVYIDILNHARRYVHIMTPYLIIDGQMQTALKLAARRGVEVCLILPHIPDKTYAFALAKTHYEALMRAGVQIYEFTPGFVHAKGFVSDDRRAVVGTINLDYRSLYHHFECACYMEDVPVVADVERDMQQTMAKSKRITIQDIKKENLLMRATGVALKLVAPLL